jgi:hypothetical protein
MIEQIMDPESKFETCKFRSETKKVVRIKRCSCKGGDYTDEFFSCEERQIQRLVPEICKRCIVYQKK